MKQIILFDIDFTLVDTIRLRTLIESANRLLLRIDERAYRNIAEEYAAGLKSSIEFSPRNYLQFLQRKLQTALPTAELLANYFSAPNLYRQALYPETLSTLKDLSKTHSLGIFSEGVREFQLAKIKLSGISQYLDPGLVFIYPDKTNKAFDVYRQIGGFWLVDDNPRHLLQYENQNEITKVKVKRGERSRSLDHSLPPEVRVIPSLTELPNLVESQPND